ncbi:Uncharacterised protein [Vibrio cholerae]|nr:Uncharacterised protein [Vibrio cholerae]
MDLVLDTVKTRHQHSCKRQVWVSCWIWEANFNTTCFRAWYHWDTDRCRTVTRRVSQHYWCFIVRNQTLVGVGGWVSDRIQRASVLDDTTNVVQCGFR